jgi:hypothetical protein
MSEEDLEMLFRSMLAILSFEVIIRRLIFSISETHIIGG